MSGLVLQPVPVERRVRLFAHHVDQVAALAAQYKASAQLSFGVEYRFIETKFLPAARQKDRHLNLAAVMAF